MIFMNKEWLIATNLTLYVDKLVNEKTNIGGLLSDEDFIS
jgi:hypothetical protein